MIQAIIVEDERHLADYLKEIISEIDPAIEIVAVCPDISPAVKAIGQYRPQLIFMDIMLPEGSGFDLLDALPERNAEVIFITAHDSFWREAFDYAAVGYVLKPVSKAPLEHAIANAKNRISAGKINNLSEALEKILEKQQEQTSKLAIHTDDGYQFVSLNEIIHLESNNAYTWIFLEGNHKILSSYNLGEFRKILPEKDFIQVHKSHIISMKHIVRFSMRDSLLKMSDQSSIPVSRRSRADFMEHFSTPRRQ